MELPPEFVRLSHCFYQGSAEDYPDREAWIAAAIILTGFKDNSLATLKAFIDRLLKESDDAGLEEAWRDADANYGFLGPGAMRNFLTQIGEMLTLPRDALKRLSSEGQKL